MARSPVGLPRPPSSDRADRSRWSTTACRAADGSINLVVAPHEFFELFEAPRDELQRAAAASICVNTEQPGTSWFRVAADACRRGLFDAGHQRPGCRGLRAKASRSNVCASVACRRWSAPTVDHGPTDRRAVHGRARRSSRRRTRRTRPTSLPAERRPPTGRWRSPDRCGDSPGCVRRRQAASAVVGEGAAQHPSRSPARSADAVLRMGSCRGGDGQRMCRDQRAVGGLRAAGRRDPLRRGGDRPDGGRDRRAPRTTKRAVPASPTQARRDDVRRALAGQLARSAARPHRGGRVARASPTTSSSRSHGRRGRRFKFRIPAAAIRCVPAVPADAHHRQATRHGGERALCNDSTPRRACSTTAADSTSCAPRRRRSPTPRRR